MFGAYLYAAFTRGMVTQRGTVRSSTTVSSLMFTQHSRNLDNRTEKPRRLWPLRCLCLLSTGSRQIHRSYGTVLGGTLLKVCWHSTAWNSFRNIYTDFLLYRATPFHAVLCRDAHVNAVLVNVWMACTDNCCVLGSIHWKPKQAL